MTRDQLFSIMRYLGYVTHHENGEPTAAALATASALQGRVTENITLPSVIATEFSKHTHSPRLTLNRAIPEIPG